MALTDRSPAGRAIAFVVVCVASLAAAIAYSVLTRTAPNAEGSAESASIDPAAIAAVSARPHLVFRSTLPGRGYGRLALIPLDDLNGPQVPTTLACQRVHYAAGTGICLVAVRGMVTSYRADLFDRTYQRQHVLPLAGIPSRARVAPDGALAAVTSFVSGDSYAAAGFSTRTLIVEGPTGRSLGDLEQFAVLRGNERFQAADFNFWGVTFARRSGAFYATLATGGQTYLVEGDTASRTIRVVREGVECPGLSPDNRRIAFKRRMPGIRLVWRIHVVDLESGQETELAETRSVDDQVDWLDDGTVIYALPREAQSASASMDVWAVPSDGSGAPRVLVADAESPAVVRPTH